MFQSGCTLTDFFQPCSVCESYAQRFDFTISFDSYYTMSDRRIDFWQLSSGNSGLYVLSLIMNREKKRIDDCTGREKRLDWGFDENGCGSDNTD